ncbi:MAG: YihA family ribosome biogenesis GTP-binding protein [Bacteroidetes bacterium]|nr:YihA family ribosome biogenesis GTP-binding protein [Bacteroidota bacterium]
MEIIRAQYLISSATHKQCPAADRPEFAFIGRSNVGKSSLINMLTRQQGLAKTSARPGKTQLINHFTVTSADKKNWYLVDLPGYGYATVSQKARRNWGNMIESYIRKRENLLCLFVLIDSRHSPQTIDINFINALGNWKIPFVLVFTKADKNKPGATLRHRDEFLSVLSQTWEMPPPHVITSAVSRAGREELLAHLEAFLQEYVAR